MPRIRSIKPDFFKSEDVSALPLRARLTWIGLWTQCDDHGRYKDSARVIKGDVWSLDDVSLHDIEADLRALAAADRIIRYEVDGKRYLVVVNWHMHQAINRPSRPKYPAPPEPMASADQDDPNHCVVCAKPGTGRVVTVEPGQLDPEAAGAEPEQLDSVNQTHALLPESSVNTHGALTPGRERKGGEGKGGDARASEHETAPAPTAPSFVPPEDPDNVHNRRPTGQLDPGASTTNAGHHGLQEGPASTAPTRQLDLDEPPPERCSKHLHDPDPPNCRACGRAREAREQWDRDRADAERRADLEARSARARDAAAVNRAAIDACAMCDATGYRDGRVCHHDPARAASTGAGAARGAIRGARRPPARDSPPDPVAAAMARRAEAREAHQATTEES